MTLRTVHLHGHLGEQFGDHFRLDVQTPAEAIRAISVQLRGFRQAIEHGSYRIVRGDLYEDRDDNDLPEEALHMHVGNADLHFVPVLHGGKKGGVGKIIAGVAIAAAAWYLAPTGAGPAAGSFRAAQEAGVVAHGLKAALPGVLGSTFNLSYSSVMLFGASLTLQGVSQLLAPTPSTEGHSFEPADQQPSFLYNGPVNVAEQGAAIPLVYGRCLVGSVVISSGIEAVSI